MKRTLALLLLLFPLLANAATIELADGTTVTGDIQGTVVLGGETKEKKVSGGIYFLVQGKDIVSITSKGVETAKDARVGWALFATRGTAPTANTVLPLLEKLMAEDFSVFEKLMRMGMAQFSTNYDSNPIGVKLMGEFANGALAPSIRVQTADGVKTIGATEVVDYVAAMNKK